ncbi:hypothetical protein LWC34_23960 [Kibdelosporangium philippinense]|uniref:Uncharacterized protein n=1 Tax=Kibdelosporangium philippinense TaxID=211113 RepID=A0ABS8ZG19_9PSEU|nr:hypothetical protein [Kibdelosporangium philippinense]MCE7005860.1 hypothetical protein [Kibdelosporangium philippinense]
MTNLLTRAFEALRTAGPEAVLTHHTALALYGCKAADRGIVHVLVPDQRRVRSRPGVDVHHGDFSIRDVENVHGLRVLSLDHALAHVLCREASSVALACFEQAVERYPPDHRGAFAERVGRCIRARADHRGQRKALLMLRSCYRLAA